MPSVLVRRVERLEVTVRPSARLLPNLGLLTREERDRLRAILTGLAGRGEMLGPDWLDTSALEPGDAAFIDGLAHRAGD